MGGGVTNRARFYIFFFLFSIDANFFDSDLSIHSSSCPFKNYTTVLIRHFYSLRDARLAALTDGRANAHTD